MWKIKLVKWVVSLADSMKLSVYTKRTRCCSYALLGCGFGRWPWRFACKQSSLSFDARIHCFSLAFCSYSGSESYMHSVDYFDFDANCNVL